MILGKNVDNREKELAIFRLNKTFARSRWIQLCFSSAGFALKPHCSFITQSIPLIRRFARRQDTPFQSSRCQNGNGLVADVP